MVGRPHVAHEIICLQPREILLSMGMDMFKMIGRAKHDAICSARCAHYCYLAVGPFSTNLDTTLTWSTTIPTPCIAHSPNSQDG